MAIPTTGRRAGVSVPAPFLAVYLGDGHGNFTQDTNNYFAGRSGQGSHDADKAQQSGSNFPQ